VSLDFTDAPAAVQPPPPPAVAVVPAAVPPDPPARPRARHRRPRNLGELAERCWRPPLALAVAIFVACGPAHALGHTDLVYHAVLVALTLSAVAVPLGCLALRLSGGGGIEPDESRP